jgi:hypothetical protein
MHEYTIAYHDRKMAHYALAVLSGLIGIGIAYGLSAIQAASGLVIVAPSGVAVFVVLFLVFDQFLWNWPWLYKLGLLRVPDLNGDWEAEISSSGTGEKIRAQVKIHQTYSKIRIHLETDKSSSLSRMAAIEMASPTMFTLRYEYSAEYQRDKTAAILRHFGVTSICLKSNDHRLLGEHSANYYTEQGRDSHGTILLKRIVKNES